MDRAWVEKQDAEYKAGYGKAHSALMEYIRHCPAFDEKKRARLESDISTLESTGDIELYYRRRLDGTDRAPEDLWQGPGKLAAEEALRDQIAQLPQGMFPIVIAGGSFNNSRHRTVLRDEDRALIDRLVERLDPDRVFFVVGHSLAGQEGYLVGRAAGRFRVYAIVPNRITRAEQARLAQAGLGVLVSIESSGMGLYKSFAYEVFKRMPSALLAFDGNSAALNLIQEARNGREKCRIYINPKSRGLTAKAKLLEGYVSVLRDADPLVDALEAAIGS